MVHQSYLKPNLAGINLSNLYRVSSLHHHFISDKSLQDSMTFYLKEITIHFDLVRHPDTIITVCNSIHAQFGLAKLLVFRLGFKRCSFTDLRVLLDFGPYEINCFQRLLKHTCGISQTFHYVHAFTNLCNLPFIPNKTKSHSRETHLMLSRQTAGRIAKTNILSRPSASESLATNSLLRQR